MGFLGSAIIRAIKLKRLGVGFRWQLEMHWNRIYGRAEWSYGIRTFWLKLKLKSQENFIPKNEFDGSLSLDIDALRYLKPKDLDKYTRNLVRRRQLAHDQEMAEDDHKFHERIEKEKAENNVTD